jgi:uncharacterized membrane protein YbaN (DUF454 family)
MTGYRLPQGIIPWATEDVADWTPLRELNVVHLSHGRLRVHLPHWSGIYGEQIVAAVRRLPGVIDAEANPLTNNALIRFDPRQTDVAVLLETLRDLYLEWPVRPPVLIGDEHTMSLELPLEANPPGSVVYMTGMGRVVYKTLGWASVGMAVFGAILPGIPTAPFVILSGYLFIRSSPEAHQWLRQSRGFGPILRDWEAYRGVRRSIKNVALGLIAGSAVVTSLLPLSAPLKVSNIALQAVGFVFVLHLHVVDPVPSDQVLLGGS